ncbi:hypothetical protein ABZV29_24640 [Streptomyces sp. NPDC005236]|uniref:hypothetical protein n=1 Tax=Streptomyces sp. NPDC005236 TaxID=3157028 RepID=UPI0033B5968A
MTSTSTEVEPTPVFVDQTGLRGRRLRGLGWMVGITCTGCVVAMVSGLVGTQSQAPALTVPGTANTTPPSQYLNAPLPAAPGVAIPQDGTTATTPASDATASATATAAAGTGTPNSTSGTTASVTPTTAAGTGTSGSASDTTASVTATTTAGTAASSSATATAPALAQ